MVIGVFNRVSRANNLFSPYFTVQDHSYLTQLKSAQACLLDHAQI